MDIRILKHIDEKMMEQVGLLLRKLDPSAPETTPERWERLLADDSFILFVAEEDGKVTGMLTLTCCATLSRDKYWIEDVIVDESQRGKGIGRALVKAAVSHVREKGFKDTIYLTSNPSRVSARALYRSEGFEGYDTGVFRMKL
ncbi:MAG: GNAT family N-acetyltransferase [Bacteroidales bacterium]|nr:GNAT family N-acetyltransferase [Bacteroidales bacterium]